ncbi:MAG: hypothetical protein ABI039_08695 [Vicinamibacterales bacterium]
MTVSTHHRCSYWAAACVVASTAIAIAAEITGRELCQRLTAEEVSAVLGAGRSAKEGDGRCTYSAASRPDVRLMNSTSDSRAEFVEMVSMLKGTIQDGPGGSVISAVAFDQQNGKTSAAWFMLGQAAVELEFDRGLEVEKARALVEAARR